jgi:hypothetical protein
METIDDPEVNDSTGGKDRGPVATSTPPGGVCQFILIVLTIVFGGLGAATYSSSGMSPGVVILSCLCALSLWAAVFAPVRVRPFLAGLFTSAGI